MADDTYPTPYREGNYQDGLRRAIMQRVSGAKSPATGTQMHVSGPLMGTGRIRRPPLRLGRRPGFAQARPTTRARPYAPPERGVWGGERRDELADAIAERLRGLFGGEDRGGFERAPIERRGRPDVFGFDETPGLDLASLLEPEPDPMEAWLSLIPQAPGGIGMLPEIPPAPGPLDPGMLLELLRRYIGPRMGF